MNVSSKQPELGFDPITAREWRWVEALIRDVEESEQQEQIISVVFQWHAAVKLFRNVETLAIHEKEPSAEDLAYHSACLHTLIGVGKWLQIGLVSSLRTTTEEQLSWLPVRPDDIDALITELSHSLSERHHEVTPDRVKILQNEIFGGSA